MLSFYQHVQHELVYASGPCGTRFDRLCQLCSDRSRGLPSRCIGLRAIVDTFPDGAGSSLDSAPPLGKMSVATFPTWKDTSTHSLGDWFWESHRRKATRPTHPTQHQHEQSIMSVSNSVTRDAIMCATPPPATQHQIQVDIKQGASRPSPQNPTPRNNTNGIRSSQPVQGKLFVETIWPGGRARTSHMFRFGFRKMFVTN